MILGCLRDCPSLSDGARVYSLGRYKRRVALLKDVAQLRALKPCQPIPLMI